MYLLEVARLTVDSCSPTRSATFLRFRGLRYLTPLSRKSLCNSTRQLATLYRVSLLCSMLRRSQAAALSLLSTKRRVLESAFLLSTALYAELMVILGTELSLISITYSFPTFSRTTSGTI